MCGPHFWVDQSAFHFCILYKRGICQIHREKRIVYLDNITIYSCTKEQQAENIRAVLVTLRKKYCWRNLRSPFSTSLSCCSSGTLWAPRVLNLTLINWSHPPATALINMPELRTFLGMIVYGSIITTNFRQLKAPLLVLLGRNTSFKWTPILDINFRKLKKKLVLAQISQNLIRYK